MTDDSAGQVSIQASTTCLDHGILLERLASEPWCFGWLAPSVTCLADFFKQQPIRISVVFMVMQDVR